LVTALLDNLEVAHLFGLIRIKSKDRCFGLDLYSKWEVEKRLGTWMPLTVKYGISNLTLMGSLVVVASASDGTEGRPK
jgi:hypothetical protein